MNIKQFPSGNWDINGIFVQKKGDATLKESVARQIRIAQARDRYMAEEGNKRVIAELKNIFKELK